MPEYRTGDYWTAYDSSDLFLFTGNGCITKDGRLVMGGGKNSTAQQMRDRFPGIDVAIGRMIMSDCDYDGEPCEYGLLVSSRWPAAKVGVFQTKLNWKDDADLDLIRLSTEQLSNWCHENPTARVDMPMPGVGLGGLEVDVVRSITDTLPKTVIIWSR